MRLLYPLGLLTLLHTAACDSKPSPEAADPPRASARPERPAAISSTTPPGDAAWGASRQLQLKELSDHNCTANMLPPWLRVSCTTRANGSGVIEFDKDVPNAQISQQTGQGDKGVISNTIIFALKENGTVPIKAGHFYIPTEDIVKEAEARAKTAPAGSVYIPTSHAHHVIFNFSWSGGQSPPTLTTE